MMQLGVLNSRFMQERTLERDLICVGREDVDDRLSNIVFLTYTQSGVNE